MIRAARLETKEMQNLWNRSAITPQIVEAILVIPSARRVSISFRNMASDWLQAGNISPLVLHRVHEPGSTLFAQVRARLGVFRLISGAKRG